ncbi:hypothetical protein QSU92_04735 [Microbacterium sp. ET2]|uniref:hypothetical protein n=1 Tax=Microbacterium albipurpureum TaxID=3050384 RepID=UPI00259C8088|nr:hypothetical protein [Microbacterium sp. ET2 (Ac-2212)]WJL96492.1 hypothetical protein QSU92_04735 [Microbacterium sp. ET2 (Ac-2212)]
MANEREPDHEAVGIGIPPAGPLQAPDDAASESPGESADVAASESADDVAERAVAAAEARAEDPDPDPEKVEDDLRERVEDVGGQASEDEVDDLAEQVTTGDEEA